MDVYLITTKWYMKGWYINLLPSEKSLEYNYWATQLKKASICDTWLIKPEQYYRTFLKWRWSKENSFQGKALKGIEITKRRKQTVHGTEIN